MSFKDYSQQAYEWLTGLRTPSVNLANTAAAILKGTATGGSETTIVDNKKDFDVAAFANKIAKVSVDGIEYYRAISAAAGDTLTITTIRDAVGAMVIIGSGEGTEGKATILCKGDIIGAVGNDYSFNVVQGTVKTGDESIALDAETKVLTVTINLTAEGAARTIGMGSLKTLMANTVDIADKFEVLDGFTAGDLPVGGDAIPFTGGLDGIPVTAGCVYEVLMG